MHPDVAKIRKQPGGPPADEWVKKMWSVCTAKPAQPQKDEILSFTSPRVDLKDITLREVRQRKKDTYCMISLNVESKRKYNKPVLVIKKQAHRHREPYQGRPV